MARRGEVKEGARRAEGHERRRAVGPRSSPTTELLPQATSHTRTKARETPPVVKARAPASYLKPDLLRS